MKAQKFYSLIAILSFLFSVSTQTVAAAKTSWETLTPGAEIRLITSNKKDEEGFVWAAIEIALDEGFKTYWRTPGETGIPMQIDWSASKAVETLHAEWPMPLREVSYGYLDYVYYDRVSFPLKLQLSEGANKATLNLSLNLGVCSNVCIPVRWQGDLKIDLAKPSVAGDFQIKSARALVPVLDEREDAPFNAVYLDKDAKTLLVEAARDPLSNKTLILDLPHSALLFGLPHSRPESDLLSVESLGETDLSTLLGEEIRLIYDSETGPFMQLVKIELLKKVD
jgi:DsbC/DsbD-like thiol-disulfide interchange protein